MKLPDEQTPQPLDSTKFSQWAKDEALSDLTPKQDGLPFILLPQPDRLMSEFASELAGAMKDKGVFNRGGVIVTISGDHLEELTPEAMRTWAEQHVICYTERVTRHGTYPLKQTMTGDHARGVLASSQFRQSIPKLARLNPVRLPVLRANGEIELLPEGYDPESRSYTLAGGIQYDENVTVTKAMDNIDDLLSEFCFAPDNGRSKSVVIAAMLTVFARGVLQAPGLVPCFIFLANAEGAGKTILASCAIAPVHGEPRTDTMAENDGEMRKELLAAAIAGATHLLFDNAKGHLNFPSLEAFLTATRNSGRVLGSSSKFDGENNTTVFITGNGVTFSPDLRRRALVAELVMEQERAEDRQFRRVLDMAALIEGRSGILSSLWAIVRAWDGAGRPKASRGHASFLRWAQAIGGMVESMGWACPLQPASIENAGDTDTDDMHGLVKAMPDSEQVKFGRMVRLCQKHGLFERLVPQDEDDELDQKQRSILGKIFGRYDRRLFAGTVRFTVEGKGPTRCYTAHDERPHQPPDSTQGETWSQGQQGLESTPGVETTVPRRVKHLTDLATLIEMS